MSTGRTLSTGVAPLPDCRLGAPIEDIPMISDLQLGGGVAELPVVW